MENEGYAKLIENFATSNKQLEEALEIIKKFSESLIKYSESCNKLNSLIASLNNGIVNQLNDSVNKASKLIIDYQARMDVQINQIKEMNDSIKNCVTVIENVDLKAKNSLNDSIIMINNEIQKLFQTTTDKTEKIIELLNKKSSKSKTKIKEESHNTK